MTEKTRHNCRVGCAIILVIMLIALFIGICEMITELTRCVNYVVWGMTY